MRAHAGAAPSETLYHASFGASGMARADIERLYSAAMFHDIGKARIPLAVLDKPGRLDESERAADSLPHRRKYLLLVNEFLRRLLELHLEFVDELEREL